MSKNQANQELPLVALIGPTNAGKSTLFNRLTGSWQAVTAKETGTTRDRVYGEVEWNRKKFNLVDTGGLVDDGSELNQRVFEQMQSATNEADIILFVYDAIEGLSGPNRQFLDNLRGRNVWLVANKVDSVNREKKVENLSKIGLPYYEVSGATGRGSGDLLDEITKNIPQIDLEQTGTPVIAIIGRPNVGKSSVLNALTNSNRAVVSPVAGTTRDIVTEQIVIDDQKYLLADTAGVRKRGKIEKGAEAFSVKRALTAIGKADCAMVVVDATVGTARGDLHLLYYAVGLEKPSVIVFNKVDLVPGQPIPFHGHVSRYDQLVVSAKTGQGLTELKSWIAQNAKLKS
ncbi:MAG: ribosome biogenesis GTPase Der [Patescibacteria group bacterium]